MRRKKRTKNVSKKLLINRALKFTEFIVVALTVHYLLNWVLSLLLILWAIRETGNFSYLDTLITETSTTFRDIVGIAVIKFCLENIFKYNDFGGKIPSKPVEDEMVVEEETNTQEQLNPDEMEVEG